jgi:hypothetical protein
MRAAAMLDRQRQIALEQNNGLMRVAMWLAIAGALCSIVSPIVFALVMGAGVVIGIGATIWRLFGIVQIRSLELLALVALLGNVIGWSYSQQMMSMERFDRFSAAPMLTFVFAMLMVTLWFLGGAASGLQIAQRLKINNTGERLWLMLLFILYPLGLAAVIGGVMMVVFGVAVQPAVLTIGIGVIMLGGGIWALARDYRHRPLP